MSAVIFLLGVANALFAARSVSRKEYGWATFSALVAIACFIVAAQ